MNRKFTMAEALQIWHILTDNVGASRNEYDRHGFVIEAVAGTWTEWRFGGMLGMGGKVWNNCGRVYVTCYSESETPERLAAIEKANALLKQFELP
jgi:hypothetical protein